MACFKYLFRCVMICSGVLWPVSNVCLNKTWGSAAWDCITGSVFHRTLSRHWETLDVGIDSIGGDIGCWDWPHWGDIGCWDWSYILYWWALNGGMVNIPPTTFTSIAHFLLPILCWLNLGIEAQKSVSVGNKLGCSGYSVGLQWVFCGVTMGFQ